MTKNWRIGDRRFCLTFMTPNEWETFWDELHFSGFPSYWSVDGDFGPESQYVRILGLELTAYK